MTVSARERPFFLDGTCESPCVFAVFDGMGGEAKGEEAPAEQQARPQIGKKQLAKRSRTARAPEQQLGSIPPQDAPTDDPEG